MQDPETPPPLDEALARIWQRAQPKLRARVDVIDEAVEALVRGDANPDAVEAGRAEAHKIAGLAGTFGLGEGTTLARAIEHGLEPGADADPAALGTLAADLRRVLDAAV